MTIEEARKVAELACNVDGGCTVCSKSLIKDLIAAFPENDDVFRNVWEERYHKILDRIQT